MKATSICNSPSSIALALPPWLLIITGFLSIPFEISSPNGSRSPLDCIPVTTPLLIWSMTGPWQEDNELGARVISLIPILEIISKTSFTTVSPFLIWWWKDIVIPSFNPDFLIASSILATILGSSWILILNFAPAFFLVGFIASTPLKGTNSPIPSKYSGISLPTAFLLNFIISPPYKYH